MDKIKEYRLSIMSSKKLIECRLVCIDKSNSVELELFYDSMKLNAIDTFPFFALVKIRLQIEKNNCKLLCYGSKINVYPSGGSSIGFNAYELDMGKPAIRLVNIFSRFDDLTQIATVEQQKLFREKWLLSISSGVER